MSALRELPKLGRHADVERPGAALAGASEALVFVVDDEASMRQALSSLIRSVGLRVKSFTNAHDFLAYPRDHRPCCLVLDVRLPGASGFDVQRELSAQGDPLPVIFMTGHGDIPMSVRAMKAGAAEFLAKPFRDQDLLDAIALALERHGRAMRLDGALARTRERYESLSPRERQVMALVVKGLLNKQTAAQLDISEITVKVHRRHIMEKMAATSLPELVRMAERLGPHTLQA
jgi:FixJ family two-component response regulator